MFCEGARRNLPGLAHTAFVSYNTLVNIEYDLYLEDLTALTNYHSQRAPRERRRRRLVQGFLIVVFLFLLFSAVDSVRTVGGDLSPGWIGASVVPLVCPAILLVLVFSGGVRRWSNNRSVQKTFAGFEAGQPVVHQKFSLVNDTITVGSDSAEMTVTLDDLIDMSRRDDRLFLMSSSEQALVVPGHGFSDPVAFDQFAEMLEGRWKTAAGD